MLRATLAEDTETMSEILELTIIEKCRFSVTVMKQN